jgi:transposase
LLARNLSQPPPTPLARSPQRARLFQHPESTAQRHYEICRAYFLEQLTADEVAERFQLQVNSIRTLVRDFAHHPDLDQFFPTAQAADKPARKRNAIRSRACVLRRQGRTLAEIRTQLQTEGHTVSEAYLFRVLQDEGLATKGQRCRSVPQPGDRAKDGSLVPAVLGALA